MPIVSGNLAVKYELNKAKELLMFHSGCHGIQVCGWCLSSQETSLPNMSSIQLKAKELLMFHSGCHGNWVTIAARYVADSYCPKKPPYHIWTQYDLRQMSY